MVSVFDLMLTRLVRIYPAHVTILSAGKRAAVLMYVLRVHIATGPQSAGVVATMVHTYVRTAVASIRAKSETHLNQTAVAIATCAGVSVAVHSETRDRWCPCDAGPGGDSGNGNTGVCGRPACKERDGACHWDCRCCDGPAVLSGTDSDGDNV